MTFLLSKKRINYEYRNMCFYRIAKNNSDNATMFCLNALPALLARTNTLKNPRAEQNRRHTQVASRLRKFYFPSHIFGPSIENTLVALKFSWKFAISLPTNLDHPTPMIHR